MAIQLGRREKKSLYILAGFLIIYSIFSYIITPVYESRIKSRKTLKARTDDLSKMVALQAEYNALKKHSEQSKQLIAKRDNSFTLFSFLEELARKAEVKDNISYMKPSVADQKETNLKLSIVEMKLQSITLSQLTQFLYNVETSEKSVYVKRLSVTKDKKDDTISTVLQVETVVR